MLGQKNAKQLKMRYLGDPVLAAKAKPVEAVTDEIRELSADMIRLMHEKNGIGLAGNQVGVLLRIVVIDFSQPEDDDGNPIPPQTPGELELLPKMPLTLINPEIISFSEEQSGYDEGCLSIPKLYANVMRPAKVVLKTQLLDGSNVMTECGGVDECFMCILCAKLAIIRNKYKKSLEQFRFIVFSTAC